jgi:hypothetical protein
MLQNINTINQQSQWAYSISIAENIGNLSKKDMRKPLTGWLNEEWTINTEDQRQCHSLKT